MTTIKILPTNESLECDDFADILWRMYCRWAENNSLICEAKESPKEKKGFTLIEHFQFSKLGRTKMWLEIEGDAEKLQQEHGLHRLVRYSPFDARQLRHTSYCQVIINGVESNDTHIRSYIFNPYAMARNHVTFKQTEDVERIINGEPNLLWI